MQSATGISGTEVRIHPIASQGPPFGPSTPLAKREATYSEMSITALVASCLRELSHYSRGEPYVEAFGLELLRRATVRGEPEAWAGLQHCFHESVRGWLRRHPHREVAFRLESEENYIAQTFERFWQATSLTKQVEFHTLATALKYLRASLNGAVLDTLRMYARPKEIPLLEPEEPHLEDDADSSELWEVLQTMLPNQRERRIAYLLFYCGLKPREIVRFCSQEFTDIQEIYRFHHNITERVQRNAHQLRARLTASRE